MYLKLGHTATVYDQERGSRKKIFLVVASSHLILVTLIYLLFLMKNIWEKPPEAISVTLVSPAALQPAAQPSKVQSAKQPPKNVSRPKAESVPVPKVQPKPLLKPTQIKKSTEIVTKPVAAKPVTQPVKQRQPTFKPLTSEEIAENMRKSMNSVKFTAPATLSAATRDNPPIQTYDKQLSDYLYSRWEQPAQLSSRGETPSVSVRLVIGADGRLTSYQILKLSGYKDMDESVRALISSLSYMPRPPEGAITIEAALVLEQLSGR